MAYKLYEVKVYYEYDFGEKNSSFSTLRILDEEENNEKLLLDEFTSEYMVTDITLNELTFDGFQLHIEKDKK